MAPLNEPRAPANTPVKTPSVVSATTQTPRVLPLAPSVCLEPLAPPSPPGGLKFTRRVSALPLVAYTLEAYSTARLERNALSLALLCTELAVGVATLPMRLLAVPLAAVCPLPVRVADRLMCLWLDCVEATMPCVKGPPKKICRPIRICFRKSAKKIQEIPNLTWITVNDLLTTTWGNALMSCADRLIVSVDGCINLVLPSPDSKDANGLLRLLSILAHSPTDSARRLCEALKNVMLYAENLKKSQEINL